MIMSKPLITFVACAHNEPEHDRAFIHSIICQTNQDFKALVFHNGHNLDMLSDMMVSCEGRENIWYKQSDSDTGNWGTVNRQTAIQECDTDYIIQTSVQDYWLPQAVDFILRGLESKPDILVWNSINHLVGPCQVLDAALEWSKLDWGNFCLKTSIAKDVGINHGTTYCADWNFINDCINKGLIKTAKKTPYILTIHN